MLADSKQDLAGKSFPEVKEKLVEYLVENGIEADQGKKFLCLNPEHNDRSPSMSVFTSRDGTPAAHCFSCSKTYDIFTCAHVLEDRPITGPGFLTDNVKYLADKYNIEVDIGSLTEEDIYEMNTYQAYRAAYEFLLTQGFGEGCTKELEFRNWDEGFAKECGIVNCPDYHELRSHLKSVGFPARFLDEIDLDNQRIFKPDNLIFTIMDEHGRPVGFSARNLKYNIDQSNGPKFSANKITGMKCNIFKKSERLFLMNIARNKIDVSNPLYIVEGYGDAVTLHANGIKTAVAIGALDITDKQLNLCRRLGIGDIVICLDADAPGEKKAKKIIDEFMREIHDLRVRFIFLPKPDNIEKMDPDEFVREHGIEAFNKIPRVDPFEWRLMDFINSIEKDSTTGCITDSDAEMICKTMIPIVAGEPSPIRREKMIKELATQCGYSSGAIKEEIEKLLNAEDARIARRKNAIVDELKNELGIRPGNVEILLEKALVEINKVDQESNNDKLDTDYQISAINNLKTYQETEELHKVINFGPNLNTMSIALTGDVRQKFILLGGKPNTGKTALLSNVGWNLAEFDEDSSTIFITIDDSAKEFIPRLLVYDIAKRLDEQNNTELFEHVEINKIAQPFRYEHIPEYHEIMKEREVSYNRLKELVRDEKMFIYDSTYGKSVSFINKVVKRFRKRHPDRKLFLFIDNLHNLGSDGKEEGRHAYKSVSGDVKDICKLNDVTCISTIEYNKIPPGQKPTNYNIAETAALEYDSNAVMHVYSDLHDNRDKSNLYFESGHGYQTKFPLIEHYFTKNKISSFKDAMWYKFYADKSYYKEVSLSDVDEIKNSNRTVKVIEDQGLGEVQETNVSINWKK